MDNINNSDFNPDPISKSTQILLDEAKNSLGKPLSPEKERDKKILKEIKKRMSKNPEPINISYFIKYFMLQAANRGSYLDSSSIPQYFPRWEFLRNFFEHTRMTSELVYLSESLEDEHGKEYAKRMETIFLTPDQIKAAYDLDLKVLANDFSNSQRNEQWAAKYIFENGITERDLPNPEILTLSELILFTSNANEAHLYSNPSPYLWPINGICSEVSDETWKAVSTLAVRSHNDPPKRIRYLKEFEKRTKVLLGWDHYPASLFHAYEADITQPFCFARRGHRSGLEHYITDWLRQRHFNEMKKLRKSA